MKRVTLTLAALLVLTPACASDTREPPAQTPGTSPTTSATRRPLPTAAPPSATSSQTPIIIPSATRTGSPTPIAFHPTDCPTLTPTPSATNTPEASLTPAPEPTGTATSTPDPSATATASLTPGPSPTPTLTLTPGATNTPTPTSTQTPHPCPSPTPTLTLTPTPSLTPTPTPQLPPLVTLLLTTEEINAFVPGFWQEPPEDIRPGLQGSGNTCVVDCAGLRWSNSAGSASLTLLLYRTPDFDDAIASAIGAQQFYLQRGFVPVEIPPGSSLPAFTWVAERQEKEFVLITSQGPAVLTLFWQNDSSGAIGDPIVSIISYGGVQAGRLRENGFLTVSRRLTPFP